MRKRTATRITSSPTTTKLRLHTETIRELQTIELGGGPIGGCLTGSNYSGPPPDRLGHGGQVNFNPTCTMV